MRHMLHRPIRILGLLLGGALLCVPHASAVVSFPGVEFNAAMGESAHASSYYDYKPNVLLDVASVPENALDGFADETSWWSAGDNRSEEVFWQVNLTMVPPPLARIVIRWHGFQMPAQYRIRVSKLGESFQTISVVSGKRIEYDRVDVITTGIDKAAAASFKFLRVVMEAANVCNDASACEDLTTATAAAVTNERVIYGIREFELWAKGAKSDATSMGMNMQQLQWIIMLVAALAFV